MILKANLWINEHYDITTGGDELLYKFQMSNITYSKRVSINSFFGDSHKSLYTEAFIAEVKSIIREVLVNPYKFLKDHILSNLARAFIKESTKSLTIEVTNYIRTKQHTIGEKPVEIQSNIEITV